MENLTCHTRKTTGQKSIGLALVVLLTAGILTSALCAGAGAAEPAAPSVGSVRTFLDALHSFFDNTTYLFFDSKTPGDVALAQANLANANDLVAQVAALQAKFAGSPVAMLDAFLGGAAMQLQDEIAELQNQFGLLLDARTEVLDALLGGADLTLAAGPGGGQFHQIEAGASSSLNNFVKKFSLMASRFDPDCIPLGLFTFCYLQPGVVTW